MSMCFIVIMLCTCACIDIDCLVMVVVVVVEWYVCNAYAYICSLISLRNHMIMIKTE